MQEPILCFLVEDDGDDQEIFLMALEEIHAKVQCVIANDGVAAIERLSANKEFVPDCIFIDVNMPRMNGIECLSRIREMNHLAGAELIMYSTTSEKKIVEKCMEIGASAFIVKPSEFSELIRMLQDIFERKN